MRQQWLGTDIIALAPALTQTWSTRRICILFCHMVFLYHIDKYIFFSVPHHIKTIKLSLELPEIKMTKNSFLNKLIWRWNYGFSLTLKFKFRKAKNRIYKKGVYEKFPYAIHHWELGRNKLSINAFTKDLKNLCFSIKSHFPNEEYHYHHFFILETV